MKTLNTELGKVPLFDEWRKKVRHHSMHSLGKQQKESSLPLANSNLLISTSMVVRDICSSPMQRPMEIAIGWILGTQTADRRFIWLIFISFVLNCF